MHLFHLDKFKFLLCYYKILSVFTHQEAICRTSTDNYHDCLTLMIRKTVYIDIRLLLLLEFTWTNINFRYWLYVKKKLFSYK